MRRPDAIIVGAGIVGACCAWELARAGLAVEVIERRDGPGSGATAAGMGHLIVPDVPRSQFELSRWSQRRLRELASRLPAAAQLSRCGCLWVASDAEEMDVAAAKAAWYRQHGVECERLDTAGLYEAEPELCRGLAGGLLLPDDVIVYAPVAARWFLRQAVALGARVRFGTAIASIGNGTATTATGERHEAAVVVLATADHTPELMPDGLPGIRIRPRKGHLAITERGVRLCRHQLAELGYFRSAEGDTDVSVAFNVQPRPTGQLLIGSSRQYVGRDDRVELAILARMLRRALHFLPALEHARVVRAWTGFRAATDDKVALIGPVAGRERLFLATGHEGVGITLSLGTGRLVADLVTGRTPIVDPEPFRPARFAGVAA